MGPKRLIKAIMLRFGLEIRRTQKASRHDPEADAEFREMLDQVRNNTMVAQSGLRSLYHQARFCEEARIEGDYVECGVWKGGAVGLMALVNLKHGITRRHLHLFDSFQDICEPDELVDGSRALHEATHFATQGGVKGRLVPLVGFYDHLGGAGTVEENRVLLEEQIGYDSSFIHMHQGWFQDTLPAQHDQIGQIAILRLDADWYASTKICLDYLFDKVVDGGFVVIDDYGTYDGCRRAVHEFIDGHGKKLYLNFVNKDIRYLIIRK